jgi:hypothetical protein
MNLLAIMFDGPSFPPGPNEEVCIFLPPIAVFASWLLTRSKVRMPAVGAAICTLSAFFVLQPIFLSMFDWHYDGFYDLKDAAIFLFSAVFPFLCLAFFWLELRKKPNQLPETTRGK